jgi:hemolysin III
MAIELRIRIFKDPMSAWTHFGGFWAALVGALVLVALCAHDPTKAAAMALYGASLAGLFLASSLYHFLDLGERGNRWLRRVDHAAIFLLIAGSYLPPLLHLLDGPWRLGMMAAVGGLALSGIVLKVLWIDSPAWLGLALYLGLGWLVLVPAHWILPQLTFAQLAWLLGGGLAYTLGAVVYAARRPDPWPDRLGHHEIWHLLVLVGAGCHYGFMLGLVDTALPPL